ncbi:hypothetical protein EII17_01155 [Clostridiales bacterium COT073_COT-073]|nr:hypothetical protein EII17_01155 [Clostridiales bacterium COT073_COT-073]
MNISCIYPAKKLAEPYQSAVKEYQKRLSRYCKIQLIPISAANKLPVGDHVFYITSGYPAAKSMSSEQFADWLEKQGLTGKAQLSFILTEQPEDSSSAFSLSPAAIALPMLTVLLFEQIYRAFRIIHHHSYHK